MRRFEHAVIMAVMCIFFLGADDSKNDQKLLQGSWQVISVHDEGGRPTPVQDVRFVFKDDVLQIRSGKKDAMGGKFTLDSAVKPKHIDLTIEDGGVLHKQPGVYLLDGKDLKIRFAPEGKVRPTDLDAKEGLFVLKRIEREEK
jgi:uncharacterized protein (TIGR03067 family)